MCNLCKYHLKNLKMKIFRICYILFLNKFLFLILLFCCCLKMLPVLASSFLAVGLSLAVLGSKSLGRQFTPNKQMFKINISLRVFFLPANHYSFFYAGNFKSLKIVFTFACKNIII